MDKPEELNLKLLVFGGVLIILLLAVSVIFFFMVYQKRLLAEQIRSQKVQSDYQQQLLASTIHAEEQERARISHDLHDEIGSALSTVKLLINQIQWHNEESHRIVGNVKEIVSNTIQDVRSISYNLHPSVLSKFGLAEAIQNLVDVVSEASGLLIRYEATEISGLGYERELAVYRIIQELVNNSVKHAVGKSIDIELKQREKELILRVSDDGCGFDYAALQTHLQQGIGLKNIEARVTLLQAVLKVCSGQDTGTRTEIRLPLTSV